MMKRIIVIGCPGSGKSTFSRKLRDKTGLPLYHLDMIWHKPDKTNVSRDEFDNALNVIVHTESWIIDGNYSRTMEQRLKQCDTVFFLDLSTEVCLQGVQKRIGVKREDMPWIEEEFDDEFREFILEFEKCERPRIYALLEKYPNKHVVIFRSHAEIEKYFQ